ncbi:putative transposable element [Trichonephila clavipes]|nr:putative transposable element [Trichonephila clavipes]
MEGFGNTNPAGSCHLRSVSGGSKINCALLVEWLRQQKNCRIWSEANPQVYVETPLHPEKLTVWCALWAGGIIGLYFFKNDEGHNVTVNGDRYRAMINNFFIPELNNHDVQELWFQQDGATCHTARATIDLLKDTFGDRLILRFGPVNWPPRSCDLTPLDYFLWGYVKSLVYADKPQTLDHLEDNIRRVIADIWPQMLEKVIENWTTSEPAVAVICQKSYLKSIYRQNCAVGRQEVGASNSGLEGLGSMSVPPNTLRVPTEYVLVKSVGPKVLRAESRVQGTGENFPPPQFHA